MKKLTEKERKFCYLVVEYMNNAKAYREAFDYEDDDRHISRMKASKLYHKPHVKAFIDELRQQVEEEHRINRGQIIKGHKLIIEAWKELWELSSKDNRSPAEDKRFYLLKELVKGSDYNKAYSEISKLIGAYEPDKVEQTIKTVEINIKRNRD